MSRYQFIDQLAATEPVQMLYRVLHVSPAGYYQWLGRAARPTPSWEPAATPAFSRHAQRYGTGRVAGRRACRRALRAAQLATSSRPACAEHAAAAPPHHGG
jgi:putative transposase